MTIATRPELPTNMLQAALAFAASGCSVVPASMNGTKAPIKAWKEFQTQRANAMQIAHWYKDGGTGLGVVTGKVSGNLEMLELEGRAVTGGMLDEIKEIAINSGLEEIWKIINAGYVELTPSGGIHWLYRIADAAVPGNTKLARRPGENGGVEVLAETRGEGGYVVVAPSYGPVHPSGQPWIQIHGSPALIPTITWDEREAIHAVFRCLDSMPTAQSVKEAVTVKSDGISPGDDYNNRASWDELLLPRNWIKVYTAGGVTYWRRPGKDVIGGISATTGRNDGDNLYVFSTSTEFEAERPYSKFAALALLEHNGDFKSCAKELRRNGYGSPSLAPAPSLVAVGSSDFDHVAPKEITPTVNPYIDEVTPEKAQELQDQRERTSWWPKPLDLDNTQEEPAPAFLAREDGQRLLYRNKVNALMGESESGKTWIALFAVQQALAEGARVLYLDMEDSARGVLGRLRALGSMDHQLSNLVYAQPDEGMSAEAAADLYESLADWKPDLVIVDGVNAAMTLLGLDLNSNTDATKFSQMVLRPLKRGGAAVLTIDHVPKSKENRGNYAIGAQAKRADIDGVAFSVEVVAPFGRGQSGELKLTVTKDRPGHVRAIAVGAKHAGIAHLRSTGENKVRLAIVPVGHNGTGAFRPTHLMEKVSKLLEASTTPLSKNAVESGVEGKREAVRAAAQILIVEGYVEVENGSRNSLLLRFVKPYREAEDLLSEVARINSAFESDEE